MWRLPHHQKATKAAQEPNAAVLEGLPKIRASRKAAGAFFRGGRGVGIPQNLPNRIILYVNSRPTEQLQGRPARGAAETQASSRDALDTAAVHAVASLDPIALRMQHVRAAGQTPADFAQRRLPSREAVAISRTRKAAVTGDDFAAGNAAEGVEAFTGEAGHRAGNPARAAEDAGRGKGGCGVFTHRLASWNRQARRRGSAQRVHGFPRRAPHGRNVGTRRGHERAGRPKS